MPARPDNDGVPAPPASASTLVALLCLCCACGTTQGRSRADGGDAGDGDSPDADVERDASDSAGDGGGGDGSGDTPRPMDPCGICGEGLTLVPTGGEARCVGASGSCFHGVLRSTARATYLLSPMGSWAWGHTYFGIREEHPTPAEVVDLDIVDVAGGYEHACWLYRSGDIYCWGESSPAGETGTGVISRMPGGGSALIPDPCVRVTGDTESHMAALTAVGSVWEWGQVLTGGEYDPTPTPRQRALPEAAVHMAAGSPACAVGVSGALYCWDRIDDEGLMLGATPSVDDVRTIPVGFPVASVQVRWGGMCVLGADGAVWCWGDNRGGRAGQDVSLRIVEEPSRVDVPPARWIECSDTGCCSRDRDDDGLFCWGDGEVGLPATDRPTSPIRHPSLVGIEALVLEFGGGCALGPAAISEFQPLLCWGRAIDRTIGDGSDEDRYEPVEIDLWP